VWPATRSLQTLVEAQLEPVTIEAPDGLPSLRVGQRPVRHTGGLRVSRTTRSLSNSQRGQPVRSLDSHRLELRSTSVAAIRVPATRSASRTIQLRASLDVEGASPGLAAGGQRDADAGSRHRRDRFSRALHEAPLPVAALEAVVGNDR